MCAMKKEIDIVKLLCDWLKDTQYRHLVYEVNGALEKQDVYFDGEEITQIPITPKIEPTFKTGDIVRYKSGELFSNKCTVATVNHVDVVNGHEEVWFSETNTWTYAEYLELVPYCKKQLVETDTIISLNDACEWMHKNPIGKYVTFDDNGFIDFGWDEFIEDFRNNMNKNGGNYDVERIDKKSD